MNSTLFPLREVSPKLYLLQFVLYNECLIIWQPRSYLKETQTVGKINLFKEITQHGFLPTLG